MSADLKIVLQDASGPGFLKGLLRGGRLRKVPALCNIWDHDWRWSKLQGMGAADCRITGNRAREVSGYKSREPRPPGLEGSLSSLHRLWLDLIVSAGKD